MATHLLTFLNGNIGIGVADPTAKLDIYPPDGQGIYGFRLQDGSEADSESPA